jgi:hypothetical protein
LKQEYPVSFRKFGGVGNSAGVLATEFVDVRCFVAEAGEDREVDVADEAWLAPALQCQTADEA